MAGGRATFEVQALRDNRWVSEDIKQTESAAKTAAKAILSRGACGGVRVVKNWERSDGSITETVVYTEEKAAEAPRITIAPIEESPVCRQQADFFRPDSRDTINRLFRKYLDHVTLTPTELLHNYKALKKVQEVDTLFPAAIDRVATLQARAMGEDAKLRRDEVYRIVAQMTQRARRVAENSDLPVLKDDFDKVVAKIGKIAPPGEEDYYAHVVLSNSLINERNWLSKLDRVVSLLKPGQSPEVQAPLDEVLADLIGSPSALQDILGYQRSLGQAICSMADFSEGHFDAGQSDARDQISLLNPMLAEGRLAETRQSLIERLLRQLSGSQPLSRHDPSKETEAFRDVAMKLMKEEGFLGGPETAAALTRRFVLFQEGGGKKALHESVGGVISLMSDALFAAVYLKSLAESSLGEELKPDIEEKLKGLCMGRKGLEGLAAKGLSPREKLSRASRIYRILAGAEAIETGLRQEALDALDNRLYDYLVAERIIERLDDSNASLRDRATRLVEFCAANLLPDGKALRMARERVVAHLKQPNFDLKFIEGLPPAECEPAVRKFRALLAKGGFG